MLIDNKHDKLNVHFSIMVYDFANGRSPGEDLTSDEDDNNNCIGFQDIIVDVIISAIMRRPRSSSRSSV